MSEGNEARDLIDARRRHLQATVGRPLGIPEGTTDPPLTEDRRKYLLGEAKDLYWNDLEWENLTGEEEVEEGEVLAELIFPGLLAYVRGLLVTEVPPDSLAGPQPRPEVVEELLEFLAGRTLELRRALDGDSDEDRERLDGEFRMTSSVLDRVLMEYHGVSPEDVGTLEQG
jgi:hypothetical protein